MTPTFDDHRRLERLFEALVACAQQGDPLALRARWSQFEGDLLRHLAEEEATMLPAFARQRPEEARRIREEHEDIRRAVLELGIDLDLHLLRESTVREFVDRLREHARREDASLYRWVHRQIDPWRHPHIT
jgi:hemerythrin-like domain-containing protein